VRNGPPHRCGTEVEICCNLEFCAGRVNSRACNKKVFVPVTECWINACESDTSNKELVVLITCLSLCNTQARAVNLIHAVLCDDEGVTRGCWRHETGRGVEIWHCTLYCLEFCTGFNGAKRQHLSTTNIDSDLSFTTIQQQIYRRKQLMDQADDNSLTALLTKRVQVRFREVVNTCTERRAEKRIQRTAW